MLHIVNDQPSTIRQCLTDALRIRSPSPTTLESIVFIPLPPSPTIVSTLAVLALSMGCSGDNQTIIVLPFADNENTGATDSQQSTGAAGSADSTTASLENVYAMAIDVYTADDRTAYVFLSDTLDVTPTLNDAFEVPGVGNFAAVSGRILVSSGDAPLITEYEISPTLAWQKRRSVSFAAYPLEDNANFFYQFIADDHTAILPFDGAKRIVWDPSDMEIDRTLEDSNLVMNQEGLSLFLGGNRGSATFENGDLMQAFWYRDEDWSDFGSSSHIAVYDADTLEETNIIDVPCPALTISSRAEDGSTYFSAFDMTATSMQGAAAAPCVAKVTPDRTLEDVWDLREWTGGHFASNFRYIGGGKAIANVFYHDELGASEIADLNPTVLGDALWDSGPFWQLWLFDIETKSAQPIEGIDPKLGIDGWSSFAVVEERTFVFLGYEQRTRVYEVDAIAGTAAEKFDISGDVSKWIRVR